MYKEDLLNQFKKFGLLYWCIGDKMWRRYGKYSSDKLEKIPLILDACTVNDRYAILEIAATVFLRDDHNKGEVSDKLVRAICKNKESFINDDPKLTSLPNYLALEKEYKDFIQFRKKFSVAGLTGGAGTVMKGMSEHLRNRLPALEYFIDVCAFVALAGHKKLPYLYATEMSDILKFFNDVLEEGSRRRVPEIERLWLQFKSYKVDSTSLDRFILPLLLANHPDVAEAVKNKQQLTLEQVKALTDSIENILPVYNADQKAIENGQQNGSHTALPKHWVANYLLKGAVDYQPRSHDEGSSTWLYHDDVSEEPVVVFTEGNDLVREDDLAL